MDLVSLFNFIFRDHKGINRNSKKGFVLLLFCLLILVFLIIFLIIIFLIINSSENSSVELVLGIENISNVSKENIGSGSFNENYLVYDVPVLVISYLPTKDNGELDISKTGDWQDTNLKNLRNHIDTITDQLQIALEKGSTYHGYKDSNAISSLNYSIFKKYEFLKQIPTESVEGADPADHVKVLQREGFNICDFVDSGNVKEVWIYMTHNQDVYPVESYQIGPNHQFGNGYMNLPKCSKSYTVYDYNYGRGLGEALEDHTHHLERIYSYIDNHVWGDLFVGNYEFEENNKDNYYNNPSAVYRCGWTHCPSNVIIANCDGQENVEKNRCTCLGYDWYNTREVLSDCEDWKPEGFGNLKKVSCHSWSDSVDCSSTDQFKDGNVGFKIYWMQNIPGINNNLTYQGKEMRNWWGFVGDFDNYIKDSRSFV